MKELNFCWETRLRSGGLHLKEFYMALPVQDNLILPDLAEFQSGLPNFQLSNFKIKLTCHSEIAC